MTPRRTGSKWTRGWVFLAVYVLVAVPLFLRTWHYGYDPTDDGLILGFSWRIWNGEIPHRDFIFTRPPLTPILHAVWFWLPRPYTILTARAAYFPQMILSGVVPAIWALSRGHVRRSITTLGLLGVSFVFALHYFPPMPWYTVDGVDFAVVGLVLMLASLNPRHSPRTRTAAGIGAGLCMGLVPFAKQNFAALTALVVVVLGLDAIRQKRAGRCWSEAALPLHAAGAGIVAAALAMMTYLWSHGALADFLTQIRTGSDAGALRQAGWAHYGHTLTVFPLGPVLGVGFGWFAMKAASRARAGRFRAVGYLLLLVWLGALALAYQGNHLEFMAFQWFWFGFGLAVFSVIEAWIRRRQRTWEWALFSVGALAVAWLSSISNGWNTPLLGMAAFGPLVAKPMERLARGIPAWFRYSAILGTASVVLAIGVGRYAAKPYHDPSIGTQYDLASIYPEFSKMYVSREVYERHRELKELSAWASTQAPRQVLVMPDFPLFYFLENRRNPASLDWWWPPDYRGFERRIVAELVARKPVILFERKSSDGAPCSPLYGRDALTDWIEQHATLIRRTARFCVFLPQ